MDSIRIRGARTHNLQNVDLDLPRNKLIVITGLSGSGKSSLAFDTVYAEGQRRYVESLSAYARQFLSMMEKPDVDHIEGLSPAISIEQKTTSKKRGVLDDGREGFKNDTSQPPRRRIKNSPAKSRSIAARFCERRRDVRNGMLCLLAEKSHNNKTTRERRSTFCARGAKIFMENLLIVTVGPL